MNTTDIYTDKYAEDREMLRIMGLVEENMANAAENGYTFEDYTPEDIASELSDMTTDFEQVPDDELLRAVNALRLGTNK